LRNAIVWPLKLLLRSEFFDVQVLEVLHVSRHILCG
jgi:hypothetical protein